MPRWVLVREIAGVLLLAVGIVTELILLTLLAARGEWGWFVLTFGAAGTFGVGVLLARWDPERWRPEGGTIPRYSPGSDDRPVRMPRLPD